MKAVYKVEKNREEKRQNISVEIRRKKTNLKIYQEIKNILKAIKLFQQ